MTLARLTSVGTLALALVGTRDAIAANGPATRPADGVAELADRPRVLTSDGAYAAIEPRSMQPFVIPKAHVESLPRVAPRYETPRGEWIPRRFNGGTFYLIPGDALATVTGAKEASLPRAGAATMAHAAPAATRVPAGPK